MKIKHQTSHTFATSSRLDAGTGGNHSSRGFAESSSVSQIQNPKSKIQNSQNPPAFTLVELLMVIVVIMVLVGISLPVAKYVTWRINYEREKFALNEIKDGLEEYRQIFGEYPIPGNPNHYPNAYNSDPQNLLPDSKYDSIIDLTRKPPVESLSFMDKNYKIDYSLTFPLMIGPKSRGELPYTTFPEVTVTYLVYADATDSSRIRTVTKKNIKTSRDESRLFLTGTPINRYLAIAPSSGKQWYYSSADGLTYTLCPTNGVQ